MNRSLVYYCLYTAVNDFLLGVYLAVMPWSASSSSDPVASVGRMFLLASLSSAVLGPILGAYVDRTGWRAVLRVSQAWRVVGYFVTALLPARAALVAYVVTSAIAIVIESGALDGVLQAITAPGERTRRAFQLGILRQCLIGVGSAAGGVALARISFSTILFASAALALGQSFAIRAIPAGQISARPFVPMRIERPAVAAAIGLWLAFLSAQLVNLVLPEIVRGELAADSRLFGLLETAWAAGGVVALALAVNFQDWRPPLVAVVLGVLFVALGANHSRVVAFSLLAALGGGFSILRGLANGALLEIIPPHAIGRTRGAIASVTSVLGIAVYALPSFLRVGDVRWICFAWGATLVLLARATAVRGAGGGAH